MQKYVLFLGIAVLLAGVILSLPILGTKASESSGGIGKFGEGCPPIKNSEDAKVLLPLPSCFSASSSKSLSISSDYLSSCHVVDQAANLSIARDNSDRSHLEIRSSLPDLASASKGTSEKDLITISFSTALCPGVDKIDTEKVLADLVKRRDDSGGPLYVEEETPVPGLKKYRAATAMPFFSKDIYVFSFSEDEGKKVIRCDQRRCVFEAFEYPSSGYLLGYSFDARRIDEIAAIHQKVLQFLSSKLE